MKKILGIVLAFVMLVTVLAVIPAAQDAAQGEGYQVHLDQGITLIYYKDGVKKEHHVAAKEMAVKQNVGDKTLSVEDYLKGLTEGSSYGNLTKALANALLNYGAAAYDYFNAQGKCEGLPAVDGDPVDTTEALMAADTPAAEVTGDASIYMGASLLLEDTIKLRFYFKGRSISATYSVEGSNKETTVNGNNPEGKVFSYVEVPVMPYNMSKTVTVKVGSTTVKYAPINYLKNKAESPDYPELVPMVASIYAYGVAAENFKAHTHDFKNGTDGPIILGATCGTIGLRESTCACGELGTKGIPATGEHEFYDTVETYALIAAMDGKYVKADFCKNCANLVKYADYDSYASDLSDAKTTLANTSVSGSISEMSTTEYSDPLAYPTKGQHPRLLINSGVLATIKEEVAAGNEEMINLLREVSFKANDYNTGANLGTADNPKYDLTWPEGTHNYIEDLLTSITSKAFLYLYTGTEYYAVEAVRYMKQYMNTVDMKTDVSDPERYYGAVMFTAALVYDWCYNCEAISPTEREKLVKGIENIAKGTHYDEENMEIGFPPSEQGAVCGHGSERQLLRDYLAVALAIYDEYPTWYDYIGGRFYEDYVPVRKEFYKSGMYPQGISVYIGIRFTSDLWSAWLMQSATGTNPYTEADGTNNQEQVIRSVFSRVVDGTFFFFDEGDDEEHVDKWGLNRLKQYAFAANISAYLYNDPTAAAWANEAWITSSSSAKERWQESNGAPIFKLILRSTGVDNTGSRHEGLDLICYNGGFLNEIVAHNGWSSSSVSVLMKIGGYTTANHDHGDAGSFQIYYKGMLAGDSGYYDTYDHNSNSSFKQYHQATIAHNSIVIYEEKTSWNGKTTVSSYGQKAGSTYSEPKTLSTWLSSTYKTADLLGVSYGYDRSGNPKYAYIAGDITAAYSVSSSYVKGAERRMLSVFNTGNSDVPMYFFVYDRVKTGSSNCKAAFLLHTVQEPTIEGNTVTVISGGNATGGKEKTGGKLVLQSVIGASSFEKVADEKIYDENGEYTGNKNYYVNGTPYKSTDDEYWGRVEIKTAKGTDHTMLNVIYVTDSGKKLTLPAEGFKDSQEIADGVAIGNSVAVFMKNATNYSGDLTFTAPNTHSGSKVNYYVSGLTDGEWTIECNGQVIYANVAEGEGILVFNTFANKEVKITKGHNSDSSGSSDNELPWDKTDQ